MRPETPIQLKDRAMHLRWWLRLQLLKASTAQLFEGLLSLVFGSFFIALTALVPFIATFFLFAGTASLANTSQRQVFEPQATLIASIVSMAIVAFSFYGAGKKHRGFSMPLEEDDGSEESAAELLFTGAAWFLSGIECLSKCRGLRRMAGRDLVLVATIFVWIFDKGGKATAEEVGNSVLGIDAVRLLPQLRDIPGVVWLTYYYEVIILSEEMRYSIARLLRQAPPPRAPDPEPEPEPQPAEEEASETADHPYGAEAAQWYKILGLPPFAPLSAVKKRYRQLVKVHHPDAARNAGGSDEQIKNINAAYHNILMYSKQQA